MLCVQTDKTPVVMVKGAPERVMAMCTHAIRGGKRVAFTDALRKDIANANTLLAKRGERVLAFAHMELPVRKYPPSFEFDPEGDDGPNFPCPASGTDKIPPVEGMTYVGLIALMDPPRMSVKEAIAECDKAKIQVFMITGDHPETAHAIAQSLDIVTAPTKKEVDEARASVRDAQAAVDVREDGERDADPDVIARRRRRH